MDGADEMFGNFIRVVRWADVVDVLLVTLFLYFLISRLRRSIPGSASRRVVVVAVLFGAIYLLARWFDLYLVGNLIRVLLIVLLLAAVVVFQSDIRRALDRIGSWGFFHRAGDGAGSSPAVDVLAEAAARLAETRTGALIAIRGFEPWDSHIQGGIGLGGKVSQPLLFSIFNPETAGHDGAVLMEADCVTKFGAHLPLAAHIPEVSRFGGTRHSAALGLAEECDALVIVVSEERGTISVAERGRLLPLQSPTELKGHLERFWQRHYSGNGENRRRPWSRRRAETAAISVGAAVLAWFVFAYNPDTVYRTFEVPIQFRNLPSDWALENDVPRDARIGISGSERSFELLNPASLVISLDLANPENGTNQLVIDEENLNLPSGVNLEDVDPREITVEAQQLEAVELPIEVRTRGELPDSLTLVELIPDPGKVTLLMPRGNRVPSQLATEPIELAEVTRTSEIRSRFVLPTGARLPAGRSMDVTVRVAVQPRETEQ